MSWPCYLHNHEDFSQLELKSPSRRIPVASGHANRTPNEQIDDITNTKCTHLVMLSNPPKIIRHNPMVKSIRGGGVGAPSLVWFASLNRCLHLFVFLLFIFWVLLIVVERSLMKESNVPIVNLQTEPNQTNSLIKPWEEFVQISADQVPFYHIILFWSQYFREDAIASTSGNEAYEAAKARWWRPLKRPRLCYDKYSNCLVTSDRVFANHAKALIFHWRDLSFSDLPAARTEHQSWVLYNLESPANTPPLSNSTNGSLYFDLLANYRRDSDLFVPYGRIVASANNNKHKAYGGGSRSGKLSMGSWVQKILPIAWMVSNCNTQSRREDYVDELSKHIQVDIYGKCGKLRCATGKTHECYRDMARDYFFYLSFENSLCRDYITEKAFNILDYDLVPIVYGGAAYEQILPPGSFIDARQYEPKELAKLVSTIMSDRKRYEAFFAWRSYFAIDKGDYTEKLYCALCARLSKEKSHKKPKTKVTKYTAEVVNQWFFGPGVCVQAS